MVSPVKPRDKFMSGRSKVGHSNLGNAVIPRKENKGTCLNKGVVWFV